ncbi:MAG: aminoacyl-histidine dipeptidase [Promethearchaeota archaeon]
MVEWAKQRGFSTNVDRAGNLVVRVPASAGREGAPVVVLQAHLDMVCEKDEGVEFDFSRDPICARVEGGWVTAEGTTLGADDGIGLAAAMGAATDPECHHGPLELLFTVSEETSLEGAANLDGSMVTGRIVVNLDSEDEGTFYVGCAGGGTAHVELPLEYDIPPPGVLVVVRVDGLKGGHSGVDVDKGRGNAVKLAARLLRAAREAGVGSHVAWFKGGGLRNAIPRECAFALVVPPALVGDVQALVDGWHPVLSEELGKADPNLELSVELPEVEGDEPPPTLTEKARDRLLGFLLAVPSGVLALSQEIPGLVETSQNLASVTTEGDRALVVVNSRSASNSALRHLRDCVQELAGLVGATVEELETYPGWKPDPHSPLVKRAAATYRGLFGREPKVTAIHAGLECGVLSERIPGAQMISVGPTVRDAHSPSERVDATSVEKFYEFLKALLADLTEEAA